MATDATGTPTSLGIPTYNTAVDAPSGNGFNSAMTAINTLIATALNTVVKKAGTIIGTRRGINFVEGANITLTVADDAVNDHVAVTVAATIPSPNITSNTQTTDYTLVLTDANKLVEINAATGKTLTVPPNSSVAFPIGTSLTLAQYGAGQVTVAAGAGVTIRSIPGLKTAGQYALASLVKRGTDEWYLAGNLTV